MDRRVGGLALLVVAAILAVLVPVILDPGITGAAVRAPLPQPPLVGSCLTATSLTVVDCSEPHDGEVTAAWTADSETQPADGECFAQADAYLGPYWMPPQGWINGVINYQTQLIPAPEGQRVRGLEWKICTIAPATPAAYLGTVRGTADEVTRPAAYGLCFASETIVSCGSPHQREQFSSSFGFEPTVATSDDGSFHPLASDAELHDQCSQIAGKLMGRDIGADDPLTVVVDVLRSEPSVYTTTTTGLPVFGVGVEAACAVETTEGLSLVDTLVGVGTAELPVQ